MQNAANTAAPATILFTAFFCFAVRSDQECFSLINFSIRLGSFPSRSRFIFFSLRFLSHDWRISSYASSSGTSSYSLFFFIKSPISPVNIRVGSSASSSVFSPIISVGSLTPSVSSKWLCSLPDPSFNLIFRWNSCSSSCLVTSSIIRSRFSGIVSCFFTCSCSVSVSSSSFLSSFFSSFSSGLNNFFASSITFSDSSSISWSENSVFGASSSSSRSLYNVSSFDSGSRIPQ